MTQIKDLLPDSDALNAVRADGRAVDELRPVKVIRGWTQSPEGSVLIECGNTRVLCTATFTQGYRAGGVTADWDGSPQNMR